MVRPGGGSGLRVQGLGFRVLGSGFRVLGLGFRVQGLGFGGKLAVGRSVFSGYRRNARFRAHTMGSPKRSRRSTGKVLQ